MAARAWVARLAAVAVGAAALAPAPAAAQSVVSTGQSFATVSLILGDAQADGSREAGLSVTLAPGWKTYWRSPGDAGIPPAFDWSGSSNLKSVEIAWPRPEVFESFGLETLGYSGAVVLPLRLMPIDPARPMSIALGATLGVCDQICVLEETSARAEVGPGAPGAGRERISAAWARVPRPGAEQGVRAEACRISGSGAERAVSARIDLPVPATGARVVVEGPAETWVRRVETRTDGSRIAVEAELKLLSEAVWIGRDAIRMTVLAGDFAADIQGCTG